MPADGGIRFGKYVLLRRIARGGMAEVFLAQQRGPEGFDRRVAVKRILPHLADSPDFVKMFLGEARLAAQLMHPNIVHIYDFGKVDSDYFIAMEYVEGIHTGQVFKHGETGPRMSPTLVARIGADAAAALHYAHELDGSNGKPLGLVHRDVSPANIMVSYDGIVKLCDFGIAKAMALTEELTNPGQVKGKYAYMSPEQTIAAPLDGRSDVFSLAIVLWELLTGRTIVPRGDAVDAMRAIRDGKLIPIDKAAPHTPAPLAKAITWALETKRDRRATAAELQQALEAVIKQSPELATPMQLAAWVRSRFPRDASGPQPELGPLGQRTSIAPGTSVAPQTGIGQGTQVAPSTNISAVTPPSDLIAASRVTDVDEGAETVAVLGSGDLRSQEDLANSMVLDELARELASANRPTAPQAVAGRITDRTLRASEEPTAIVGGESMLVDERETVMASGAQREIVSSAPAVVPTRFEPRLEVRPSQPQVRRSGPAIPADKTMGVRAAAARRVWVPFAVLGGIALLSFLIALRACSATPTVAIDAGVDAVPRPAIVVIDAAIAVDARPDAAPPDAAPPDAAVLTAELVINTTPPGATVTIGNDSHVAPSPFALDAGTYQVVAELEGYETESREITIGDREHKTYEIAFRKRAKPARMGRLSVRSTPSSEVYLGPRRLGKTPLEVELPAGSHTLVLKHPARPPTTRTVKIVAGRLTRLVVELQR